MNIAQKDSYRHTKQKYVYQPSNRYLMQQGVSVYTPMRKHELKRAQLLDRLLSILFGPSEPTIPKPSLLYIDIGIPGPFSQEKMIFYHYAIEFDGFGLVLTADNKGIRIKHVYEHSDIFGVVEKGSYIEKVKFGQKWYSTENMDKQDLKALFSSHRNKLIHIKLKQGTFKLHRKHFAVKSNVLVK